MTIQIQQTFPHCERCGIMIHTRRPRIVASTTSDRAVVFCSELCRGEYTDLFGLGDPGEWSQGSSATPARRVTRT